jgi:hypothetical protein
VRAEKTTKRKYAERGVSFYPLKPEEVLSAFMKVNPEKIVETERRVKAKK